MNRWISLTLILAAPVALALVLAVVPTAASALPAGEADTLDGKAIFLAQKCELCHSVSTAGIEAKAKSDKMKGPDLVGVVTAEHDADWMVDYLRKAADLEGKKHGKAFTGSDEELGALVSWLADQKKP